MQSNVIKVIVIEDHPLFRGALEELVSVSPQLQLVGSHPDGHSALAQLTALEPDVAVLDLGLPDMDGATLIKRIGSAAPQTRMLVLSGTVTDDSVQRSLAAGASGYLAKDVEARDIIGAIIDVAADKTVLSTSVQHQIAATLRNSGPDGPQSLTAREHAVLALAGKGVSSRAIANELHVSRSTVKAHLSAAYRKLDARDRASAVLEASRRGLI